MSGFRRVDILAANVARVGFGRGLRMQVAGRASRLRDGGDGVFEDELFLSAGFEQDRKLVKTSNTARELGAIQEINDHGSLFTAHRVEKRVLNILRCLFAV